MLPGLILYLYNIILYELPIGTKLKVGEVTFEITQIGGFMEKYVVRGFNEA